MKSLIILSLVFVCESIDLKSLDARNNLTFGNCSQNLEKYNSTCLEKANNYWGIKDNENPSDIDRKQFCCSVWDYMFCIIEKARDEDNCTNQNFDTVIDDSMKVQKLLEENDCYHYSRDALFECHFYWLYYFLCSTILIFLIAMLSMIIKYFNRRGMNKKSQKF